MKTPRNLLLLALLILLGGSAAPAGNPLLRYGLPAAKQFHAQGEVLERLEAGSYRYLRLRTPQGEEVWVATLAATASDAAQVDVLVFARAHDFKSPRLNRSFEELWFGAVRAAPVVQPVVPGALP